ncbi:MAG: DMT family transporter [Neomegalonema sp.]|nr:DMT family transporter [Neomegalonema sp.]
MTPDQPPILPSAAESDSQDERQSRDNLNAALWILISCGAAAAMMIAIRFLSSELDSRMITFLRSALGCWVVLHAMIDQSLWKMQFSRPGLQIIRGILMGLATNFGFYAIVHLPIATANVLFLLASVFATVLSVLVLHERVGLHRWGAVIAGLLGAVIILRPGAAPLSLGMLSALASSACFGGALLLTRVLRRHTTPREIMISSIVASVFVTFPIALPVWQLPAEWIAWSLTGAVVLFSTLRQYCDIRAYSLGEAGFLAPFNYVRVILIAAAGWVIFGEGIDPHTGIGGMVIASATLYIARRERSRRQAQSLHTKADK